MVINGKDINFKLNVRATKDIAEICPGRDIMKIDKIFDRSDYVAFIENMTTLAVAMSKNRENAEPLTAADIDELDIEELNAMISELQTRFGIDRKTNVHTESIKKKAEEDNQSTSE